MMVEQQGTRRAASSSINGLVTLDEHRSIACFVYDISETSLRVTLPDTDVVPDLFMLTLMNGGEIVICRTAWRRGDEIGCTVTRPERTQAA